MVAAVGIFKPKLQNGLKDFAEINAITMEEQLLDFFGKALAYSKRNPIT